MDYIALAREISLPDYRDLSDGEIAVRLTERDIATDESSAVMPSDFVARFTPAETVAILDSTDPVVRALLLRLRTQLEPMSLTGQTVAQGLAYLAAKGLIAAERVPDIAAVAAGPLVTRCEQIGCGLMLDMDEHSRTLAVAHAREITK